MTPAPADRARAALEECLARLRATRDALARVTGGERLARSVPSVFAGQVDRVTATKSGELEQAIEVAARALDLLDRAVANEWLDADNAQQLERAALKIRQDLDDGNATTLPERVAGARRLAAELAQAALETARRRSGER